MNAHIRSIASYLPENKLTNNDVLKLIDNSETGITTEILDSLLGACDRYYAHSDEMTSNLAVKAAKKILRDDDINEIDLLIFASACADLIEPATSNIVQFKLGLSCACFDIKNACNSVATALEVGNSLIKSGQAKKILVVSGEKPSDSIKFKGLTKETVLNHLASYTFGDAGVAMILEASASNKKGFLFQKNRSFGEHWNLCNVLGGGSMYPHDASKLFFSGQTFNLKNVIQEVTPPFVYECLEESGYTFNDIDFVCSHQVSKRTAGRIKSQFNIELDKIIQTYQKFGNTASTSMPIALEDALKSGRIKEGKLVLLLGLAAGVNISFQLIRF